MYSGLSVVVNLFPFTLIPAKKCLIPSEPTDSRIWLRLSSKIEVLSNDISELDNTFKFVKNSVSDFDKTMDGLYQTQNYYNEKIALTEKKLKNYSDEITNSTEKIKYHELSVRDLSKELAEQEEILIELKDCVDYDIYDKMDAKTSIYAIEDSMLDLFTAIDDECLDDRDISDIEFAEAIENIKNLACHIDSLINNYKQYLNTCYCLN